MAKRRKRGPSRGTSVQAVGIEAVMPQLADARLAHLQGPLVAMLRKVSEAMEGDRPDPQKQASAMLAWADVKAQFLATVAQHLRKK